MLRHKNTLREEKEGEEGERERETGSLSFRISRCPFPRVRSNFFLRPHSLSHEDGPPTPHSPAQAISDLFLLLLLVI